MRSLKDYFLRTGFFDLLPVAVRIARGMRFTSDEMIATICEGYNQARVYW